MKRYDKITGVLAVAALSLFSACSEDTMDRINKDHDEAQLNIRRNSIHSTS